MRKEDTEAITKLTGSTPQIRVNIRGDPLQ